MTQGRMRPEVVARCTIDDGLQPKVYRLGLERIPTTHVRYTVEFTLRDPTGAVVPIGLDPAWRLVIWWDGVQVPFHLDSEKHIWRANITYRRDEISQFAYTLEHAESDMLPVG